MSSLPTLAPSGFDINEVLDIIGQTQSTVNGTGPTKRTKVEMGRFRQAIYEIVKQEQPCSVRHVYYAGIGILWDKDTGETKRRNYKKVSYELGKMREKPLEMIPWEWITDNSRWIRIDTMYDSLDDAMARWRESYRRNLWASQPRRIEVWCESDSIAGTIDPVTRSLGVGLYPCQGQAPKTFARNAAVSYTSIGKPVTIFYVGDWDPSGLAIERSLEERLRRYSEGEEEIDFTRLAVTPDDIRQLDLIRHEVNEKDVNYGRFVERCELEGLVPQEAVEVEALGSHRLRDRVKGTLLAEVDDISSWNSTIASEKSERDILAKMRMGMS